MLSIGDYILNINFNEDSIASILNTILIISFIFGMFMVYFGYKEGFWSPKDYSQAHKGALLGSFSNSPNIQPTTYKDQVKNLAKSNLSSFDQVTNNHMVWDTPCNGEDYFPNFCSEMYGGRIIKKKENNYCDPGLSCQRVGYFCSKI